MVGGWNGGWLGQSETDDWPVARNSGAVDGEPSAPRPQCSIEVTRTVMKRFQNPSPGWPGLTNGKARTGDGRAIRFAPDPATHANNGFEITS